MHFQTAVGRGLALGGFSTVKAKIANLSAEKPYYVCSSALRPVQIWFNQALQRNRNYKTLENYSHA